MSTRSKRMLLSVAALLLLAAALAGPQLLRTRRQALGVIPKRLWEYDVHAIHAGINDIIGEQFTVEHAELSELRSILKDVEVSPAGYDRAYPERFPYDTFVCLFLNRNAANTRHFGACNTEKILI